MTDSRDAIGFEARLRRLEDRFEIGELIARYGLVMDNRDFAAMPSLFTADAKVRSSDGMMDSDGCDAVCAMYRGRLEVLGPSNHVTHDRILTFDDVRTDQATGLVLSHAEMSRKGVAMVAAIRYHDEYRREDGRWKFAARTLAFMYFVRAAEYVDALGPGIALRNRVLRDARAADWPEALPTWRDFYGA